MLLLSEINVKTKKEMFGTPNSKYHPPYLYITQQTYKFIYATLKIQNQSNIAGSTYILISAAFKFNLY